MHLSGGWSNPGAVESNLLRGLPGDVPFSERTVDDVIGQSTNAHLPPIRFDYPLAWQGIWATALRGLAKETKEWVDAPAISARLITLAEEYLDRFNKSLFMDEDLHTRTKEQFDYLQQLLQKPNPGLPARARPLLIPLKEQKIGQVLKLGTPAFWSTGPFYDGKCDPFGKTTSVPFTAAYQHGFLTIEERIKFADQETAFGISNATGSIAIATTAANLFLVYLVNGRDAATDAYIRIAESKRQAAQTSVPAKSVPWNHGRIGDYADGFVITADSVAPEVRRILETQGDAAGLQYAFQVHIQRGLPTGISLFPPTVDHAFVKRDDAWGLVDTLALTKAARAA